MARVLVAIAALGWGVSMSLAAPLEDATLRVDGDGFRLVGRLLLEDGLYAVAEARYGKAFDGHAELELPPVQTTLGAMPVPEARAVPDLSLPGPATRAGWLRAPEPVAAVAAGELRFEPPTGPEGTGLAPPAPGIDLEHPRGVTEGSPRARGARDLSPLEVEVGGVGTATLKTDFDQRQVQQRVLAPNLSQPFLVEVAAGDARWRFRYDSGLEQFDPNSPTEDQVSQAVLGAWGRRDEVAVADTVLFRAIRKLLTSQDPLAGRTQLTVVGLALDGEDAPRHGKLYHLPGPPRSGALTLRLERHDWHARPALVEDQGARPAAGVTVRAAGLGSSPKVRVEGASDAEGVVTLGLTAPDARRLRFDLSGPNGTREATWAAWRWGRPEEAWLDSGRPRLEPLEVGTPDSKRLASVLGRILETYSPDDGNFHGPQGSSGLDGEVLVEVIGPALARAADKLGEDHAAALAALRDDVADARKRDASESANWAVLDPRRAPSSGTSLKALSGGLEVARRELGTLRENTWSLGLAAAGAKLATRLAAKDAGPGAALLQGGTRELLDQLKSRAAGEVHRAVVMTKAGPEEGRAFPEDEWTGRLYLALAFHAAAKAFPDGGFAEAAAAQEKRLAEMTRPAQAFPDSWSGKGLGTLARVLGMLVDGYGVKALSRERAAVRAELWTSLSSSTPDRLADWIDALQGWL